MSPVQTRLDKAIAEVRLLVRSRTRLAPSDMHGGATAASEPSRRRAGHHVQALKTAKSKRKKTFTFNELLLKFRCAAA